jgi:hypothetical protein
VGDILPWAATFCRGRQHFAAGDNFPRATICRGRQNVARHFVAFIIPATFCRATFCLATFCLATFNRCTIFEGLSNQTAGLPDEYTKYTNCLKNTNWPKYSNFDIFLKA